MSCLDLLKKLYEFKRLCIESDNVLWTSLTRVEIENKEEFETIKQEVCKIEYDEDDIENYGKNIKYCVCNFLRHYVY